MKKTYVLDTNILIQSPHAFLNFEDNDIIIPFVVLEELDGLKKVMERRDPMQEKQ